MRRLYVPRVRGGGWNASTTSRRSLPRLLDAIDVDRDGRLELLVEGDGFGTDAALIRAEDMAPLWTLEYAYNACPC